MHRIKRIRFVLSAQRQSLRRSWTLLAGVFVNAARPDDQEREPEETSRRQRHGHSCVSDQMDTQCPPRPLFLCCLIRLFREISLEDFYANLEECLLQLQLPATQEKTGELSSPPQTPDDAPLLNLIPSLKTTADAQNSKSSSPGVAAVFLLPTSTCRPVDSRTLHFSTAADVIEWEVV
ncbi:hypothetical protein JOB18_020827 [Solea senegalensis]|uniref:Uncharacterized protein n=1 Tax=Solea senegalensis TaxID=28829 RepID=A0AAV6RD63_SOLSE|nr:hypothetical protein JOB18_020827 [Solea senegalensis]